MWKWIALGGVVVVVGGIWLHRLGCEFMDYAEDCWEQGGLQ